MNKLLLITFDAFIFLAFSVPADGQTTKDLLVVSKPHIRYERQRHNHLADENGYAGEQTLTCLDFKYRGKIYSALLYKSERSVVAEMSENIRYKFLVLIARAERECEIVKIWNGKKLLWSNPKFAN